MAPSSNWFSNKIRDSQFSRWKPAGLYPPALVAPEVQVRLEMDVCLQSRAEGICDAVFWMGFVRTFCKQLVGSLVASPTQFGYFPKVHRKVHAFGDVLRPFKEVSGSVKKRALVAGGPAIGTLICCKLDHAVIRVEGFYGFAKLIFFCDGIPEASPRLVHEFVEKRAVDL